MALKNPKIGVYGDKMRSLQRRLSFEHVSLSWRIAKVWMYLGSRTNNNPNINDIGNPIFSETPDRAYDSTPVEINIDWEQLPEQIADLSSFGIHDPSAGQQTFKVHTKSYDDLGRSVIEGDILELPFLEQDGEKTYFEVTDYNKNQEFEHFYGIATGRPMTADRTTQEIPDKNDNADIFNQISTDLQNSAEADVTYEGLDTTDATVDDSEPNEEYDPRNDQQGSLLDDPSATY